VRNVEAVRTTAKGNQRVRIVAQPANALLAKLRQMMLVLHARESAPVWMLR